jgi:hypothetical protein
MENTIWKLVTVWWAVLLAVRIKGTKENWISRFLLAPQMKMALRWEKLASNII